MRNEFTAIVERDGPWYVAYCAEGPGANGQGKSSEECLTNLRAAIALILEHRREESLRSLPPGAGVDPGSNGLGRRYGGIPWPIGEKSAVSYPDDC